MMIPADVMREPEIWAAMCRRFPWVEAERGEIGEGLLHLEFATLRAGVERSAASKDLSTAEDVCGFVEELFERADILHPDVLDALDVSFLEDLYLSEHSIRDFAYRLLGPRSQTRWLEIARAHENAAG